MTTFITILLVIYFGIALGGGIIVFTLMSGSGAPIPKKTLFWICLGALLWPIALIHMYWGDQDDDKT